MVISTCYLQLKLPFTDNALNTVMHLPTLSGFRHWHLDKSQCQWSNPEIQNYNRLKPKNIKTRIMLIIMYCITISIYYPSHPDVSKGGIKANCTPTSNMYNDACMCHHRDTGKCCPESEPAPRLGRNYVDIGHISIRDLAFFFFAQKQAVYLFNSLRPWFLFDDMV